MAKPKILIQVDPDSQSSTFDSIVAIDSDVDQLLTYSNVTAEEIQGIVQGAMFTRGPKDLQNTAIFFGGRSVEATEALIVEAKDCFFGSVRVSIMADPNGANTTAAAAMACAESHFDFSGKTITVLGATGPVGLRLIKLIADNASQSAPPTVRVCSRSIERAKSICDRLIESTAARLVPLQTSGPSDSLDATRDSDVLFSAGAAGIELLKTPWMDTPSKPEVAVDLNAVPPSGIAGIDVMDSGEIRHGTICYGAIGVGNCKMKLHKKAIQKLFESNDQVLELEEIYRLAKSM